MKQPEQGRRRRRMRGGWRGGCMVFGRKMKGLLGCWQFLFIDLGGAYVGIYLEIIIMLYVFVLYTPLCVHSTSQ